MTPLERLKQLKELAEQSTPGPWRYDSEGDYVWGVQRKDRLDMVAEVRGVGNGLPLQANGEFIAASRDAIPSLVTALERALVTLGDIASWCPTPEDPDKCRIAECKFAREALEEIEKLLGGEK